MASKQSVQKQRGLTTQKLLTLSRDPGSALHQARRKKGLTVNQAAKKLKTTAETIRRIESWNIDQLMEPIFLEPLIRSFAALVNLDATTLLKNQPRPNYASPNTGRTQKSRKETVFIGDLFKKGFFGVIGFTALAYLLWLAVFSVQPPSITYLNITDGQTVSTSVIEVSGVAQNARTVKINESSLRLELDNTFSGQLVLNRQKNTIIITASNGQGATTAEQLIVYLDQTNDR